MGKQKSRWGIGLSGLFLILFFTVSGGQLHALTWAPGGLAVATALWFGSRALPALALANLFGGWLVGEPWPAALGLAFSATTEAAVALLLVESRRRREAYPSPFWFLSVLAPTAAALGSLVELTPLLPRPGFSFLVTFLRHYAGIVAIAPFVLAWAAWFRDRGLSRSENQAAHPLEGIAFFLTLLAVSAAVFSGSAALAFLLFPLLTWAAFRFPPVGVTTVTLVTAILGTIGTIAGTGPFGNQPPEMRLFILEGYLIAVAVTGIVLAASVDKRWQNLRFYERAYRPLQDFIDHAATLSAKLALDGRIQLLNRAALHTSGLSEAELKSRPFGEGPWWEFDPAVQKQVQAAFQQALTQKHRITLETKLKSPSAIIPINLTLTPVRNRHDELEYIIAEGHDISQLKKAQYFLAEAQKVAGIGSWEWDAQSDTFIWSDELCRIHGWQRPEQRPRNFSEFIGAIHPEDRDRVKKAVQTALADSGETEFEERVIHPDGKVVQLLARGMAIADAQGKSVRLIGTCQDISMRKRLERERAELLLQEKEARRQAELANQAKDHFLASLSHELRTPLSTISAWSQLLQQTPSTMDPDKRARGLRMIQEAATTQGRMIEELLDVSRIMAGKVNLDLQLIDPCDTLLSAAEALRPEAEKHQVRYSVDAETCIGQARLDPTRLRQIIWNLVTNAIRYTPPGGAIQVSAKAVHNGAQDQLILSVADTGAGMAKDFLPSVFKPFTQFEKPGTQRHRGLGMGLAIVKTLAELQGGTVQAESPGFGQGSRFTVSFPLFSSAAGSDTPAGPSISAAPDKNQSRDALSGVRILLVEDEPSTREALALRLSTSGAEVIEAESAEEAWQKLHQHRPRVLISDIGLPKASGYELMQRIRSLPDPALATLPAAALTAFAARDDLETAFRAGFTAHLPKPVDLDVLVGLVSNLAKLRTEPLRKAS